MFTLRRQVVLGLRYPLRVALAQRGAAGQGGARCRDPLGRALQEVRDRAVRPGLALDGHRLRDEIKDYSLG